MKQLSVDRYLALVERLLEGSLAAGEYARLIWEYRAQDFKFLASASGTVIEEMCIDADLYTPKAESPFQNLEMSEDELKRRAQLAASQLTQLCKHAGAAEA